MTDPYEADPLLRLERNAASTRQALWYLGVAILLPIIVGFTLALVSRSSGGPYCERDASAWLCSSSWILLFGLIPSAIALVEMFIAAYLCYRKWKTFQRWRTWLAVVVLMVPYTMSWVTSTGALIISQ